MKINIPKFFHPILGVLTALILFFIGILVLSTVKSLAQSKASTAAMKTVERTSIPMKKRIRESITPSIGWKNFGIFIFIAIPPVFRWQAALWHSRHYRHNGRLC